MRVILSILFCFSIAVLGSAQNIDRLKSAFADGNASYIANYFPPEVEISIDREHDQLSQKEAQANLQSFFARHRPIGFTNLHEGASGRNATGYLTGDLETQSGKFRVFIYFEDRNGGMKIKEIRMDKI